MTPLDGIYCFTESSEVLDPSHIKEGCMLHTRSPLTNSSHPVFFQFLMDRCQASTNGGKTGNARLAVSEILQYPTSAVGA